MAKSYPRLQNKQWLTGQVQVKPLRQIAEELGCSYSGVLYSVRKHGIKVPRRFTHRSNPDKSAHIIEALRERYPEGRFGEQASNWKGGRHKQKSGYIMAHAPDHPRSGKGKRLYEHILIAEEQLGRYLLPGEVVHHINHIKDDNRPENLEVVSRSQHIHNHFDTGNKLIERIAYLEALLDKAGIKY